MNPYPDFELEKVRKLEKQFRPGFPWADFFFALFSGIAIGLVVAAVLVN